MAPLLLPPPQSSFINNYKNSQFYLPMKLSGLFFLITITINLLILLIFWPKNQSIEVPYDKYEDPVNDVSYALITVTFNNTQRILKAKLKKGSKYINRTTKNVKIEYNPFNKSQFNFYTNEEELYEQQTVGFWILIIIFFIFAFFFLINIGVDLLSKKN